MRSQLDGCVQTQRESGHVIHGGFLSKKILLQTVTNCGSRNDCGVGVGHLLKKLPAYIKSRAIDGGSARYRIATASQNTSSDSPQRKLDTNTLTLQCDLSVKALV